MRYVGGWAIVWVAQMYIRQFFRTIQFGPTLVLVALTTFFLGCRDADQASTNPSSPAATTDTDDDTTDGETTGNGATGESEVTMIDPEDILFTTPTLNDTLPSNLSSSEPGDDCYQMHEDDWRQFEFVSATFESELKDELAEIDKIWAEQSVPLGENFGFRAICVRKKIPTPLDVPLSVDEFQQIFGQETSAITIRGFDSILADVHAIRLDKVIFYATISNGRITTLGIEPLEQFILSGDAAARLEEFVTNNELLLVHWRSRTLFKPQDGMKYLRGDTN